MAVGTIGSVISTFTLDSGFMHDASAIRISGTVYAIAYRGVDGAGWLKTINVQAEGGISDVIDSLEFETDDCWGAKIVSVSGDIYAIAYQDADDDGKVVTVEISSAGAITDAVVNTGEWATHCHQRPAFIKIADTVFAAVTTDASLDGWIYTFSIANNGTIGAAIDSLEFEPTGNVAPIKANIINVSGDIWAIAYQRSAGASLCTVDIDSSGNIGAAVVDSLDVAGGTADECNIAWMSGNIYAFVYQDGSNDGVIATVAIYASGQIDDAAIDSLEFETSDFYTPSMLRLSPTVVAIAYRGTNSDGYIVTIEISSAGVITDPVIASLEYDTSSGVDPTLLPIPENTVFAVVYNNSGGSRGYLKTIGVTADSVTSGTVWVEGIYLHYFDENGVERLVLGRISTDDDEILTHLSM